MLEATADIWEYADRVGADAIVIPTNWQVKRDGRAVMGKGLALEARERYENIDAVIGFRQQRMGPQVFGLTVCPPEMGPGSTLIVFPTKYDWRRPSSKDLIAASTRQLVELADELGLKHVLLPRVGCGAGTLDYGKTVRPILEAHLDDRFTVCDKAAWPDDRAIEAAE